MKKVLSILLSVVMLLSITSGLSLTAQAQTLTGACGLEGANDVTYSLDTSSGTLTISGTGYMFDGNTDDYPWHAYRSSIKSIVINNGVKSIGIRAFSNCENVSSITLGNSLEYIYSHAFYDTAYYDDEANWENGAFYIGNYLIDTNSYEVSGSYQVKEGTLLIADGAFNYCSEITGITLPNSLKYICPGAFSSCAALPSISIPNSVISIGEYAFDDCTELGTIQIGTGVKEIGFKAFDGTKYYNNSANWQNGILYIGNYLIKAEATVSGACAINPGTRLIAERAFQEVENITSLDIPNSLTYVGETNFSYDPYLASIKYNGTSAEWYNLCNTGVDASNDYFLEAPIVICTDVTLCNHGGEIAFLNYKSPTCTENGKDFDEVCTICGAVLEYGAVIPATGHAFSSDSPTCLYCGAVSNPNYVAPAPAPTPTVDTPIVPSATTTPDVNATVVATPIITTPTASTVAIPTGAKLVSGSWVNGSFKKPTIKKLAKGKKQIKVSWKKVSGVKGYQIQYSTSKKFTKKTTKSTTVSKNSAKNPSKTIKKLKSKKKYYVRIRTYKVVNVNGQNVKVYSNWSKTKSVKTK